ncbi:glycosyltransferase [Streptomyces sp. AK02-01A]|uniref:glycosyltransferase n=1 Tax=Streptomyces sp. AK02-01A TaxID=3028648 RepID=UPI0029BAED3A|nr:nucleotide disphospho-sugar-binding domain-containing protein [Streptomyces sp. AK02-01A]MDX3850763.1 hypothetical protein [Streptomyces sp. AK02-01A]
MAHVLVASTPIYGHFAPMRSIARSLIEKGHDVTFLTGSGFREAVESAGATFAALSGDADYDAEAVSASEERLAVPVGIPRFEWDMRNMFLKAVPAQHAALQRLLAEAGDQPPIVLVETGFWGVFPILRGAPGIRPAAVITVGTVPLVLSSVDTAPFGMGLPADSSPAGRERNQEANILLQEKLLGAAQAYAAQLVESAGATEALPFFLDAAVLLPDRFLQLSVPALDYERSDAPDSLRFIGALPSAAPESFEPPEWWQEVLDADRVVVVTQGTIANHDFSELIEPALEALADLDVLVVAATGRADITPARVPANARVATFIPFDLLLPHTDVLVTNGGYGGVQQGLSHGVPMVVAGDTEDKVEVTARAAGTGAAINLGTGRPEAFAIGEAVTEVLKSPGYRDNAQRLKALYAALDPFTTIADTIEEYLAEQAR